MNQPSAAMPPHVNAGRHRGASDREISDAARDASASSSISSVSAFVTTDQEAIRADRHTLSQHAVAFGDRPAGANADLRAFLEGRSRVPRREGIGVPRGVRADRVAAAIGLAAVRTMFLSGCCAVRETRQRLVWNLQPRAPVRFPDARVHIGCIHRGRNRGGAALNFGDL